MTGELKITRMHYQSGLTLIELMIAMVLGLLVVLAAGGIFLSNQQASRSTQAVGYMQDASLFAFELIAKYVREAGGNACDAGLIPNVLATAAAGATPLGSNWFLAFDHPLYGFEANAAGSPAHQTGADVLQLIRMGDDVRTVSVQPAAVGPNFAYLPATPAIGAAQYVYVCDHAVLGVFNSGSTEISGGTLAVPASGNTCTYFSRPNAATCGGTGIAYQYDKYAMLGTVQGVRWFTRDTTNGPALFRQVNDGAAEEVLRGVGNLQLSYLTPAGYVLASDLLTATGWQEVRAVRITMDLVEEGRSGVGAAGAGASQLSRRVEHVVTLRNRVL